MIATIEDNVTSGRCDRFYFLIAPFQLLVAVTHKTINNLVHHHFTQHNPAVLDALRIQDLMPREPIENERDQYPFRHYEETPPSEIAAKGGFVCTTANSLHNYAGLIGNLDRYPLHTQLIE